MAGNRGVVYLGPGNVAVQSIDFPKLALGDRKCEHGVILKVVSTNICGSDQHMVRGRTTAPRGLVLGHEITGEVLECGRDVEFIKKGDLEHAMAEPEKYQDLFVRVGGFSARFVDLPKDVQREVFDRTTY